MAGTKALKKKLGKREMKIAKRIAGKKRLFLKKLRECGSMEGAAVRAGIGARTMWRWRSEDAGFAAAGDDAVIEAYGELRATMFERARCQSDGLATFLARGRWPDEFRDERIRVDHMIRSHETFKILLAAFHALLQKYIPRSQHQEAIEFFAQLTGAVVPGLPGPNSTQNSSPPFGQSSH